MFSNNASGPEIGLPGPISGPDALLHHKGCTTRDPSLSFGCGKIPAANYTVLTVSSLASRPNFVSRETGGVGKGVGRGRGVPLPPGSSPPCLGFLMHGFWGDWNSSALGGWATPAAGKTLPKGGGRSAPSFGRVFPAAGAARTPKSRISGRPKKHLCNPRVKLRPPSRNTNNKTRCTTVTAGGACSAAEPSCSVVVVQLRQRLAKP